MQRVTRSVDVLHVSSSHLHYDLSQRCSPVNTIDLQVLQGL